MNPIERGRDWGLPAPVPPDAIWVESDAAAAEIVATARKRGAEPDPVVLTAGDLARTLGGRGDRSRLERGEGSRVEVDVGAVLIDGRLSWFVAHLVARRSWWRGRTLAICNAAFLGRWNIAPRAHPGDGMLDLIDADLALTDRVRARSRLAAGTHVPHPRIVTRRVEAMQVDFNPALDVHLDGRRVARARTVSVRVEPGALEVWV